MSWKKIGVFVWSIYIILISTFHRNVEGAIPLNTTRLSNPVCITNGVISSGVFFTILNALSTPNGNLCTTVGSILLQPGVLFLTNLTATSFQIVGPEGLCVTRGLLNSGIVATIGTPISVGQNISSGAVCSTFPTLNFSLAPIDYVFLQTDFNVFLEILPANTRPSDVFIVQDSPLLNGISYTLSQLNQSVCIDSGVLVTVASFNAFADNVTLFDRTNGMCTNGTLPVGFGSDDDTTPRILFSNDKCLGNSFVVFGRVLVTGTLTPVGQTIPSGIFAGLTCSMPNITINGNRPTQTGVVLRVGVYIIIPTATTTTTRTTKYRRPPYDYNRPSEAYPEYNVRKDYDRPSNYYYPERIDSDRPRTINKSPKKSYERDRTSKSDWQRRQVDMLSDYIGWKIQKAVNKENDRLYRNKFNTRQY